MLYEVITRSLHAEPGGPVSGLQTWFPSVFPGSCFIAATLAGYRRVTSEPEAVTLAAHTMAKSRTIYSCSACGAQAAQWRNNFV